MWLRQGRMHPQDSPWWEGWKECPLTEHLLNAERCTRHSLRKHFLPLRHPRRTMGPAELT